MDSALIEQLYHTYRREIFLYLYSLCGNRGLAEDLQQETFLKALLSLPEGHTNMRAWLYMVARNLYFNDRQKKKNEAGLNQENIQDVDEQLFRDERRRLLYEALSQLEGKKREILLMQYFGELSQKEIAAVLHMTPVNVRVLGHRAKKELKSYLEEKGYDIS